VEDFGTGDRSFSGGVEGGVPFGAVGGIVSGIEQKASPTPTDEPVRLDFRSEEARPLVRVDPHYPALAVDARVEGVVILEVLVGVDGVPESIDVLRSVPLLEASALRAVGEWRWNPYLAWPSATTKGGIGHRGTETQRFIGRAS
jgi:protein TonB